MTNPENEQLLQNLNSEDFLRGWCTIPNRKGLSEDTVKREVALAGVDTDIIAGVDETDVFVLSKAKDFVRRIVSPTDGNPSKS